MNQDAPLISVIVPLAPEEQNWRMLISDLLQIQDKIEVILALPFTSSSLRDEVASLIEFSTLPIRVVESSLGRAKQMNNAALTSRGEYLWFLHADSRLNLEALKAAVEVAGSASVGLYYFDLSYDSDGPRLTWINAMGAYLRSHLFGLPFGDQGFLLRNQTFEQLGQFPDDCRYGEDHLFVWKAKRSHLPIVSTRARITTSARRYRRDGWIRTTFWHAAIFSSQVVQQIFPSLKVGGAECENPR